MLIVKGDTAESASRAHSHTHKHTLHIKQRHTKKEGLKLSLFMRLQCNTLSLAAQGRQLADPCAKQIRIAYHHLFLQGLFLPHFIFSLSNCFLFFHYFFCLCFLCVCVAVLGCFLCFLRDRIVIATAALPVGLVAPCYV